MQYNGKKDTLEIFNDTWKVNHQGNIPNSKMTNKSEIGFKVNKPSTGMINGRNNKPIGYNNINRNGGYHG